MIANTTHALHDFGRCGCCCRCTVFIGRVIFKIFTFNLVDILQNNCSISKSIMHIWMWWLICAWNMFIYMCLQTWIYRFCNGYISICCHSSQMWHPHARTGRMGNFVKAQFIFVFVCVCVCVWPFLSACLAIARCGLLIDSKRIP